MSSYKIKVVTEGTSQAASDLSKLGDSSNQAGEKLGKLDTVIKRAAQGLNKLGNEIPIVGYALNALKNPFTIVATVVIFGIAKFREYSEALKEIVSNTDHASRRIKVSAESYSNAADAVTSMATAMKELRGFTKNVTDNLDANIAKLDEQFAATEKLIDAEAELAKVKLDRDEPDPVKRAKAKAAIDDTLAGTKLGLAGKKGQQAALVEKQRLKERQLQVDAVEAVPSRESLVASVSAFETDRSNLEEAKNSNRQAFGKAELIRRFVRDGNSPDFYKIFAPSDIKTLEDMGLVSGASGSLQSVGIGGEMKRNDALANEMLPGAEADLAGARDRKARAQSAFNYSRGALHKGISQLSDIDPFLDKAEPLAAGEANDAYRREESLTLRRDSLLRGQQNEISIGRINTQQTSVKGQLSVREAEAAADKAAETFERLAERLDKRMSAIERRGASQSQQP